MISMGSPGTNGAWIVATALLLAAGGAVLAGGGVTDSRPSGPPPVVDGPALERALLVAVNAERASHGAGPLATDARLIEVARAHSRDMARRGFFGHFDPEGRGPGERLQRGYAEWVGAYAENVYHVEHADALEAAEATPEALARRVVQGWMGSPGHRQNLLRVELTASGLGVWAARDAVWITHDLGRPVAILAAPLPACVRLGIPWSLALRLGPDLEAPGSGAVEALLVWPDPSARFPLPGGRYLEGARPVPLRRTGSRLELTVPPLSEPGTYRVRLGRDGQLYDLGSFRADSDRACNGS